MNPDIQNKIDEAAQCERSAMLSLNAGDTFGAQKLYSTAAAIRFEALVQTRAVAPAAVPAVSTAELATVAALSALGNHGAGNGASRTRHIPDAGTNGGVEKPQRHVQYDDASLTPSNGAPEPAQKKIKWVSVKHVAKALGVKRSTVYSLCKDSKIDHRYEQTPVHGA